MILALCLAGPVAHARVPYSDAELRAAQSSDEKQIESLRSQELNELRITLGRRLPANRRADLYYRLAELYVEAYRANYLLEGRVHEKRIAKGEDDRFTDHAHSAPYLKLGVKACHELLALRIPFDRLDQIYFFLGFNYGELGDHANSIKSYGYLVDHFPQSPFAGEAYREMGEAAFDKGEFRKAQAYFESAERKSAPDTLPRIQHKLAWTYYRTKQHDRAVSKMKEAIATASKSGEKYLNLREEALKDMAIFMTETGRVDEAIAYFKTVADQDFYAKALERLGKQYERNVEPAKATQVYESLLKTNPNTEASFRVLVKLVDLDLRREKYPDALKRLDGVNVPKGGESDTQLAAQNLKAMVRRTATEHHDRYRKKQDKAALEIAEQFYQAYINTFLAREDGHNELPEIQMYLAEVKRDLGKSKEASALYRKVVDSRDNRYAKEAGALWTASLAEAIKASAQQNPRKGAAEPSGLEKEFVDAADQLQEALGDTNEGREAALRAAQVLAGYRGTQKDAIKRIKKILKTSPKSQQAVTAARLWVQIHSEQGAEGAGDLKDAMDDIRENQELIAFDQANGGKLKGLLTEQDTQLKISTIAREEKEKDYKAAAKGYENLAAETQERDLAEKAYANAVSSYLKEGDGENAVRVADAWLKRYPKTAKAIDSLRIAATQFLIQGKFDPAASLFEKLGRDTADADSLETAARIAEGNGNIAQAQKLWADHNQLFPKSNSFWRIRLTLARSWEAAGKDGEAAKIYQQCMSASAENEAECGVRLAGLHQKSSDRAQAKAILTKVAGMKNKKGEASPYIGYARFQLADAMESASRFEPLQLPEAQLKKALTQRLNFLEPLSKAYSSVVDAGGPWSIAALDRLARWAYNFAEEIDRVPPPASADAKAKAEFAKNLATYSTPIRQKAIATWTDAYSKAVAAEALSPALPELADRLADARSKSPARAQGFHDRYRLAGASADSGGDALSKTRDRLLKNPQDHAAWVDYGNMLWGMGKPVLARLAYDRAISLNSKNPAALNNRAVVLLTAQGEEDWQTAGEASALLSSALSQDSFFIPAKMNRAALLNYYRLFSKAKPLWEQVLSKGANPDAQDGLAIAEQGTGSTVASPASDKKSFATLYHRAARESTQGAEGARKCLSDLEDIPGDRLSGFEKQSVERLKGTCTRWKSAK